jgi:UDP-glucose 4-epimerase
VADCVRGTLLALERAPVGETFNIGGGQIISLNTAIATIAEALETTPRIERAPRARGDQRHTAADISRATAAFGYRPETPVRDGLRRQVEWHLRRRADGAA